MVDKVNIERDDFGIEIELIMKLSKISNKIYEIGINYNGRSYDEGKKINRYRSRIKKASIEIGVNDYEVNLYSVKTN